MVLVRLLIAGFKNVCFLAAVVCVLVLAIVLSSDQGSC
jgi:hypothetical protein